MRRHSVTSAIHLPLSSSTVLPSLSLLLDVMDVRVLAKRWSRSEDRVDLMRSMRCPRLVSTRCASEGTLRLTHCDSSTNALPSVRALVVW